MPARFGDSLNAVRWRIDAVCVKESRVTQIRFPRYGASRRRFSMVLVLTGEVMNRLVYIVGLVVIVLAVLWFFGLR